LKSLEHVISKISESETCFYFLVSLASQALGSKTA